MDHVARLADLLLERVAPRATATAQFCEYKRCDCVWDEETHTRWAYEYLYDYRWRTSCGPCSPAFPRKHC